MFIRVRFLFCFVLIFLRQSLTVSLWLAWYSLCRWDWPWTHRDLPARMGIFISCLLYPLAPILGTTSAEQICVSKHLQAHIFISLMQSNTLFQSWRVGVVCQYKWNFFLLLLETKLSISSTVIIHHKHLTSKLYSNMWQTDGTQSTQFLGRVQTLQGRYTEKAKGMELPPSIPTRLLTVLSAAALRWKAQMEAHLHPRLQTH